MWGTILAGILARPWARWAAGVALAALTVALFFINLRRAGERAGRAAGRLETLERDNTVQRQMLEATSRRPGCRSNIADALSPCAHIAPPETRSPHHFRPTQPPPSNSVRSDVCLGGGGYQVDTSG